MRSPLSLLAKSGASLILLAFLSLAAEGPVLDILSAELDRNMTVLQDEADPPAYFLAYEVTENEIISISASLGSITGQTQDRSRSLDVSVRVGDRNLDNYHPIPGEIVRFTSGRPIALEDNQAAIRRALWEETDRTYRLASQRLIRIETDNEIRVSGEETPPDFSVEEPVEYTEDVPQLEFPVEEWSDRMRRLSAEFSDDHGILLSTIGVAAQREVKYLVTSEGTRLRHGRLLARIQISAQSRAPDGMSLTTSEFFEANDHTGLPGDEVILATIHKMAGELTAMVDAPAPEAYVGPAILSGRAAGVFFHEIFGHRIEGHRMRDVTEGQTFAERVGSEVLPDFLSVVSDPTLPSYGGAHLMGSYQFDDEGIPARRVTVVEDGLMRTFLLSRSPLKGFPQSNGHGRRQSGREVAARQSNLIVESTRQVSEERLREMLIEEIRRQNKEYGYYFDHVTGGYTMTGRGDIQAYKVIPLVVYRVYADGRPDELVRGVDIVGTPLASFAKILATGDTPGIFNGYCGAESGNVPVSAVSPALLVSELEIQKQETAQDRPPLLPRPTEGGDQ